MWLVHNWYMKSKYLEHLNSQAFTTFERLQASVNVPDFALTLTSPHSYVLLWEGKNFMSNNNPF